MARAASRLGPCAAGDAVITPGFHLRARFVIHTVGPVWHGGGGGEAQLLERAYKSAFALAHAEATIRSIAFPAISTGAYGFPKQAAATIAVTAMRRHEGEFDRVVACLFDKESLELYRLAM